jgi:hypothetical protein
MATETWAARGSGGYLYRLFFKGGPFDVDSWGTVNFKRVHPEKT